MINPTEQLMRQLKNIHINDANKKWLIRLSVIAVVLAGGVCWLRDLAEKHKVAALNLAAENSQLQLTNVENQKKITHKDDQIQQLENKVQNMQQAQAILAKNNTTSSAPS
jgi:hypothetical protein